MRQVGTGSNSARSAPRQQAPLGQPLAAPCQTPPSLHQPPSWAPPAHLQEALHVRLLLLRRLQAAPAAAVAGAAFLLPRLHRHALDLPGPLLAALATPPPLLLVALAHQDHVGQGEALRREG